MSLTHIFSPPSSITDLAADLARPLRQLGGLPPHRERTNETGVRWVIKNSDELERVTVWVAKTMYIEFIQCYWILAEKH